MDILFFGSSHHSLLVLNSLYNNPLYKIVGIVSQPAQLAGRQKLLSPTPVSEFAKKHGILLFTPETLNKEVVSCQLSALNCQLIIVADYGLKLPKQLIGLPKYGALNIHPSLLPAYRGSSPAQWAILRGEKETGVTILTISEEFDQGKIVAQKKIPVLPTDTQETLYERCFNEGAKMLVEILPPWIKFQEKISWQLPAASCQLFLPPMQQGTRSPTSYTRKLTKDDGQIDWSKPDVEIERMIRAFDPWPGSYTTLAEIIDHFNGKGQSQKAQKKEEGTEISVSSVTSVPSEITKSSSNSRRIKVLKAHLDQNSKLQIDKLQIEGKTPITWMEFARGYLR